jgi:hypothetical protein
MTNIEKFLEAREYLVGVIDPFIETFLCGIWDACIKFTLERDTQRLIEKDLIKKFPDIKPKYLPKVKFRLDNDVKMTQVSIQNHFNIESSLIFLGSAGIGNEKFDFYYRNAYDPHFKYMFLAKYGHGHEQYYSGSKTAEAEYYLGAITPLAVAYGMALDDGIV